MIVVPIIEQMSAPRPCLPGAKATNFASFRPIVGQRQEVVLLDNLEQSLDFIVIRAHHQDAT